MEDIASKYKRLLAVENAKNVLEEILPGPEAEGDPFWAIMEVDRDGLPTGSYHTVIQDGMRVLPLYERRSDAEMALRQAGLVGMAVRGINRGHMRVLVGYQEKGFIQLGFCVSVEGGEMRVICPAAKDIRQMLESAGCWHDKI